MATARYDDISDYYAARFDDSCADPATAALLQFVGSPNGRNVLDVACGHGRVARNLARRGGSVVGVDISAGLLDRAREIQAGEPLSVRYELVDVTSGQLPYCAGPFDVASCNLGLSDIDELRPAFESINEMLKPGAQFVWSILHPCFPGGGEVSGAWPADGRYSDEGFWIATGAESALRRQVGANHRTLSTYINTLISCGFEITAMAEPNPGPGWEGRRAEAAKHPVYLVVDSRRR